MSLKQGRVRHWLLAMVVAALMGSPAASADDRLVPGEALEPGESIISKSGRNILVLQKDGNLVLLKDGKPAWASSTNGSKAKKCEMQKDGNLVIYFNDRAPWATGTQGNRGAWLVMQDDGNLVVYGKAANALWSSKTNDGSYVAGLPWKGSRRVRLRKGHHVEVSATVSSGGKIHGNARLECTHDLEGFTAGWMVLLGDKKGNVLYASPQQDAGINAAAFRGKRSRDITFEHDYPANLEGKVGSVDIFIGAAPSDAWNRLHKNLEESKKAAKTIKEIQSTFD